MRRPIGEDAYDKIRYSIVLGEYRPNQRLVETELASDLGISRTPIREALHRLETEGLIVRAQYGWVVYEHASSEIREIYEIRAALESYAARMATERLDASDRERLVEITSDAIQPVGLSAQELVESNERFHHLVLEVAGNQRLTSLSERTSQYYFNRSLAASYSIDELTTSRQQHLAIVEAILAGEADEAARLVREHVETALQVGLAKLSDDAVPHRLRSD